MPADAERYIGDSRSALGWIIDRYRVETDKSSGFVNTPTTGVMTMTTRPTSWS
jgi:predicted helicase